MKQLLIAVAAALMLALPASGSAASTTTVKIVPGTPTAAFQPASVTVAAGDTVQWTNTTNVDRQVVADQGNFVSPVLKPGQSYSFRFKAADTYAYHDALHPAVKGSVAVKGPPPTVTLEVDTAIVRYGQTTTISGQTTGGNAGDSVTITAQPLNGSTQSVGSATVGSDGSFTYTVKPTILTTYTATWNGSSSQTLSVQVRPRVTFTHVAHRRLYVKVHSGVPHAGNFVFIQRRTAGGWATVMRLKLGPNSGRYFNSPHVRGYHWYRAYLSPGQAGPGYTDSASNSVRVYYRR